MFYFPNTRKPDFRNLNHINYNDYWMERGFKLNDKLKAREEIIFDLIKPGSRVMDIGCGTSLLPVKLKEKKCLISVADISDIVLKGYSDYNIHGEIMNLENIDQIKIKNKLDYIILSEVLEHTRNPEEIIKKLKDYTDFFIISIPNSAFYRYRLHLFFSGRFFTQWVYHPSEHLRYWSHIDFLEWLDAMDLSAIKDVASNGLNFGGINLYNIWKNMFAHQIVYLCKVGKD